MFRPTIDRIVDRPIFVVGAGRSGSTIFHKILSEHVDVAWQSVLCDLFPARPGLNGMLLRAARVPVVGPLLKRYFKPSERYRYWEHYCPGFSRPCRDLLAADVTAVVTRRVPAALARLAAASSRRRVLVKITGWPRIGYLSELFPDAKFIHVYRDGRAVANSLLEVDFWSGWQGPGAWRAGDLTPAQRAEWERYGKSFVALAGIQWKVLMAAADDAARRLPTENFLPVRYEDFVEDPVANLMRVADFCGLRWSDRFEKAISGFHVSTANDKWRMDLTDRQQTILESVLSEALPRYGYTIGTEYSSVA